MQAARHSLFALLVFASLLFVGTVLEILFFLCALWGVSAFSRMVTAKQVSVAVVEAELSRLVQISRSGARPLPLAPLSTVAAPHRAAMNSYRRRIYSTKRRPWRHYRRSWAVP
jgi:hypothetical protein